MSFESEDVLDELFSMSMNEVIDFTRDNIISYKEEGYSDGVAQIKALEDICLWLAHNKHAERAIRQAISEKK